MNLLNNELILACIATAPSFGAGMLDKLPRNDPMGVLAALTITTSFNFTLELYDRKAVRRI